MRHTLPLVTIRFLSLCLVLLCFEPRIQAVELGENFLPEQVSPIELNGYFELRSGWRTGDDPYEKDVSVMEARFQAEAYTCTDWAEFRYKGDVWADGVTEEGESDTREAWFFSRPADYIDIKVGRQILTWGTGDLVFLNDMFPKDWQSYFIGRDKEYLKAPSDAVKISLFMGAADLDVVYTPRFDPDRYITGEYISYWNEGLNRRSGQDVAVCADEPDSWFEDDEVAVRIYKNINNYELAIYGYHGFWKRPGGQTPSGVAIFPELNVYGFSVRGQVGPGIGNIECAYYLSVDDENGSDPLVNNSELRYLAGYTQDLAKDFNASIQYYLEYMMDYSDYRSTLSGGETRDHSRHVITLQLTKLLMNQNLELGLASYYSPSDRDAYLRPTVRYKYTDRIVLEAGANIFNGKNPHTFFGQFEKNTNIYASVRYSLE